MGEGNLGLFTEIGLEEESFWIEFISMFRPHTTKEWDYKLVMKWKHFLRKGGVYVKIGRNRTDRAQKLVDLLFRESHIKNRTVTPRRGENQEIKTKDVGPEPHLGPYVHPDRAVLINQDDSSFSPQPAPPAIKTVWNRNAWRRPSR